MRSYGPDPCDAPDRPPRGGRPVLIVTVLLAGLIAMAMAAAVARRTGGTPVDAAQRSVDDAMAKLRASDWLDFEGVTRPDLERRLLLLDAAIYASDAYADAVGRLDPAAPDRATPLARRDAYAARARVLRTGRRAVEFLRAQYGHWQYDPAERRVRFDDDVLVEQFAAIQAELHDVAGRMKDDLATRPTSGPTTTPSTAPAPPAPLPVPTRLPPDDAAGR